MQDQQWFHKNSWVLCMELTSIIRQGRYFKEEYNTSDFDDIISKCISNLDGIRMLILSNWSVNVNTLLDIHNEP